MGMEKYEAFVRIAKSTLTYKPGWSMDNRTGAWRTLRPVKDGEACNDCGSCWLFCPEGCIERGTFEIDYDYCKGCGICSKECRPGAITLEREAE
ncbi:MAG: 4Fe-4S binding protein [Planctomycetota bacterium]|jgi:2-oxoacid:acceptor oxidoreductase delta subunit (pyruvate/2-ketoisovalerate family)